MEYFYDTNCRTCFSMPKFSTIIKSLAGQKGYQNLHKRWLKDQFLDVIIPCVITSNKIYQYRFDIQITKWDHFCELDWMLANVTKIHLYWIEYTVVKKRNLTVRKLQIYFSIEKWGNSFLYWQKELFHYHREKIICNSRAVKATSTPLHSYFPL